MRQHNVRLVYMCPQRRHVCVIRACTSTTAYVPTRSPHCQLCLHSARARQWPVLPLLCIAVSSMRLLCEGRGVSHLYGSLGPTRQGVAIHNTFLEVEDEAWHEALAAPRLDLRKGHRGSQSQRQSTGCSMWRLPR